MEALLGYPDIVLPIILILSLCLPIHHISAQLFVERCNNEIGNYSHNSTFHTILNTIISVAYTDVSIYTHGVYNFKAGVGLDWIYFIATCGEGIDYTSCSSCVNDAAKNLTKICPNQKEAIIWYDKCMFRYSSNNILGVMSISPGYYAINTQNASSVNLFSRDLHSLVDNLINQTYEGSFSKLITMKSSYTKNQTIYAFMQCTPDITPGDCLVCLKFIAEYLSGCCFNRVGARYFSPSCNFRYELYPFFYLLSNQTPPPPLPPPPPPSTLPPTPPHLLSLPPLSSTPATTGKSSESKTIIILVCVIVPLLVSALIACVFITKRRWKNTSKARKLKEELEAIGDTETRQYEFSIIRAATKDFSTANLLGRGGFGDVYKGVLSDGKEIAVKRLSNKSGQGEIEFMNEVLLLARLQHICLVKLLGFCLDQKERLLVYELMANGSLDNILFNQENQSRLDWEERYRVINNIAKGLVYLHEDSRLTIIHRDLKASNILLDRKMNAKISDFGMARLFVHDESEVITKRIAGTFGYIAPEYAMHGLYSVKSDVYSYGVLLLEIVSGKRNYYSLTEDRAEGLLGYAYKTWKGGRVFDLIDPVLRNDSNSLEIMMRCIHISLLCVQENVVNRPTMATVILMLQSLTISLPSPSEPGFFINNRSWLSQFKESTISVHANVQYDLSLNEETDSYLFPR